jgi:Fe-S cluster biogenesis protein NfuA
MTRAWELPPPHEAWLDHIRPALLGVVVEPLAIDADGTVRIDLQGACGTCLAQLANSRVARPSRPC